MRISYCLLCFFVFATCKKNESTPPFAETPESFLVQQAPFEISGIADSKNNPGFLWAQEDGGNAPQLFFISHQGVVAKRIPFANLANRDWEDLCYFDNHLYLADIGDNNAVQSQYFIYRFAEPLAGTDSIRQVETIRFQYEDGPHDAEAFWADPGGSLFVVTKRGAASRIYEIKPPFSATNVARLAGTLPYNNVVSLALSPQKTEVLVKTYDAIYHYTVTPGETVRQTLLNGAFRKLAYTMEPQGEAITFAQDNSGFFTLSERGWSNEVRLYWYRRR